ncbi:hypothetical protein RvY_18870 [Ramazzottius varieornatus]|uniref:Uncharacterized protein n=1 Tax=Ramazzottius varieornatus TaxID=947166 RepID=A0A1D1W7F7_RAMVA|nr:hypothetical protein RvY_18870 [Ramazzottius varieornatus]
MTLLLTEDFAECQSEVMRRLGGQEGSGRVAFAFSDKEEVGKNQEADAHTSHGHVEPLEGKDTSAVKRGRREQRRWGCRKKERRRVDWDVVMSGRTFWRACREVARYVGGLHRAGSTGTGVGLIVDTFFGRQAGQGSRTKGCKNDNKKLLTAGTPYWASAKVDDDKKAPGNVLPPTPVRALFWTIMRILQLNPSIFEKGTLL